MFYRDWDRNMIFLGKRLCFTSPFSWRSSPQGSDIRSCLKCPMLRTCCSPSPLCSRWSRWTSTVLGRTLAHLVGHLDGRKGARTWSQCVWGPQHSAVRTAVHGTQCARALVGPAGLCGHITWDPVGLLTQPCWDLVTYAHPGTVTDVM